MRAAQGVDNLSPEAGWGRARRAHAWVCIDAAVTARSPRVPTQQEDATMRCDPRTSEGATEAVRLCPTSEATPPPAHSSPRCLVTEAETYCRCRHMPPAHKVSEEEKQAEEEEEARGSDRHRWAVEGLPGAVGAVCPPAAAYPQASGIEPIPVVARIGAGRASRRTQLHPEQEQQAQDQHAETHPEVDPDAGRLVDLRR